MGSIPESNAPKHPQRTLETPRLILRGIQMTDAEDLHECFSDIEVMRYWSSLPHANVEKTQSWVEGAIQGANSGWLDFVICLKGDVRCTGLHGTHAELEDQTQRMRVIGKAGIWHGDEIGFLLNPAYWGNGFAVEALSAALDVAFELDPYGKMVVTPDGGEVKGEDEAREMRKDVVADVDPRNKASLAVLKKLGFEVYETKEKTFQIGDEWVDSAYLSLTRETWQVRRIELRGL